MHNWNEQNEQKKNQAKKQHRQKERTRIYVYKLKNEWHKEAKQASNRDIRQQQHVHFLTANNAQNIDNTNFALTKKKTKQKAQEQNPTPNRYFF